jgi:hypothetical protein
MSVYVVVRGLAEAIPPEKLPPEVRAFVELLHLDVVDEPVKLLPPGFKTPVWLIPVLDAGTGETVGILNAYPPLERERYAVATVTNKLGRPVTVITFREEAERLKPKPKMSEVAKTLEAAKREVPRPPVTAPIDWKSIGEYAGRISSWVGALEKHTDAREAVAVYSYLQTMNEWIPKLKTLLLGYEPLRRREEKPTVKVLKDEEYERLWREFSEVLAKAGLKPELYRERFEELIAWNMPYEDNRSIVLDEARGIVAEAKLSKYMRRPPEKPVKFTWRLVEWACGSLSFDALTLMDAVKAKDPIAAYGAASRMLMTVDRLKRLMELHPDVKAFLETHG